MSASSKPSRGIDPTAGTVYEQPSATADAARVQAHHRSEHLWFDRLAGLHRAVRAAVLGCGRERTGLSNAKGDAVRRFDLAANDAALSFLETLDVPLVVASEETEPLRLGVGSPRHRLVLDPVDGSDNWAQDLPLSAVSCAVLAMDAPLHPDFVEWAMVGPLDRETPLLAGRGVGAWCDQTRLQTSAVDRIADAVISVELNHFAPPPALSDTMAKARAVRSYGCASGALALIASGGSDAHIDLRRRLTAESYLAAARLVLEAGGTVCAPDGGPLASARGLTDRVELMAAASEGLCQEIAGSLY